MRFVLGCIFLGVAALAPASANDPLSSLRYLVGAWNCTYHAGATRVSYKALFSYDMGGNWVRERDSWAGGGNDLGMFTYEPKRHGWTAVVIEPERSTVVFRASGDNPNHIVYRSLYPDTSMTEIFVRDSPTRYTLQFTQISTGKTTKSNDLCVKI
jgi:hypothetical protein